MIFLSGSLLATTLPDIPYHRLVSIVDAVVLGEVLSSRDIKVNGFHCGSIHTLKVERVIKGSLVAGDVIAYGPYSDVDVGGQYILFLDHTNSRRRLIATTNSALEEAEYEVQRQCHDADKALYKVVLEGMGSLPVVSKRLNDKERRVVVFPPMWVLPPADVSFVENTENESVWGREKLVMFDELLR